MKIRWNEDNLYYISCDDGEKYAVQFFQKDAWRRRTTKKDGSPLKKPVREVLKHDALFVNVGKYDDENNGYYIDAVLQSYFSGLMLNYTRADMETILSMLTGVNCEIIGG